MLPAKTRNQDGVDDLAALLGVGFVMGAGAAVLLDDALIIVAANPPAERMLGSAGRSLPGPSIASAFGSEQAVWDAAALRQGVIDHLPRDAELITLSGDRFVAELRADGVTGPSGARMFCCSCST